MLMSNEGLDLIREFEGLKLTAYQCQADVWTIGYGHTRNVVKGMKITKDEADGLLSDDVRGAELCLQGLKIDLTQPMFDALGSLIFNIGVGAFKASTLCRHLKEKRFNSAATQFKRWINAGGIVSDGLVRRREAEEALFRKGIA